MTSLVAPHPVRHLLRAKDLADRCYPEQLTVARLAQEAGLSRAYFAREFRRVFGESPHQYLLTRRLERAATLLRSTDWSVARICNEVGWSSQGSFGVTFRRVFGTTPTRYRRSGRPVARDVPIPVCVVKAHARPRNRTFRDETVAVRP